MRYALSLECKLTRWTRKSHCETPSGKSSHDHPAHIVSDLATHLPELQAKIIFDIGCDDFAPNVAIILPIHALHLGRVMNVC